MCFDIAILNVKGYTLTEERPEIKAIGIKDNIIAATGANKEIKKKITNDTIVIDGNNKVMIPAFCDSHVHFATLGVMDTKYINLIGLKSRKTVLHKIEEEVQKRETGEWIAGINWDESDWTDNKNFITREELDNIAPHNPVSLQRIDGHIIIANSKALAVLDLDPDTTGYEIIDGQPTGRLMEEARFKVRDITEADVSAYKEGILAATEKAYSLGVTAVHDVYVDKYRLKAYQELWQENKLNIRAILYLSDDFLDDIINMGCNVTLGNEYLRLAGIKIFTDGSIGAKTAWVKEGYKGDIDNKGIPIWSPEKLQELIIKAHMNDIHVSVHAIGDQAVTNVINSFAAAQAKEKKNLQHRIEHLEMVTRKQLKKMKDLGLVASMQPNFVGKWGHPGGMYEKNLNAKTIKTMDPFTWIKEEKVQMLMGSDGMPFNPFYGIHSAVNAPFACQQLSVVEAIKAYTRGASFSSYINKSSGEIKEGKLADLILLDKNPFTETENIKDIRPELTIFDGKIVYQKG